MMTEQEFLNKIRELGISVVCKQEPPKRGYYRERSGYECRPAKTPLSLDHFLQAEWCTGGISGGNCWESGGHHAMEGDPPAELDGLDTLLEAICPKITFIQYKRLLKDLVEIGDYEVDEYYGNCTRYSYKVVSLRKLYQKLQEIV